MAMGRLCYIEMIECEYATSVGSCRDDIRDDFGLCEMHGDDMPPKGLDPETRRQIAVAIRRGEWKEDEQHDSA